VNELRRPGQREYRHFSDMLEESCRVHQRSITGPKNRDPSQAVALRQLNSPASTATL